MRKIFKVTCAALLLSAGSASAQLQGSDTLYDMINDTSYGVLANCPGAAGLTYAGGGSSNAITATVNDAQEIAPSSRYLNATECTNGAPGSVEGCYRHALDGLAVVGHESAAESCTNMRWSGSMALTGGGTYTFDNWRTVLRIIYGGIDEQPAAMTGHSACEVLPPSRTNVSFKNCASNVRTTLINSWSNMFQGGCTNTTCTAGLKHAFRRDDVSGTTDVFLELLALPAIASVPFCNGTEVQDLDPVRRQCTGTGFGSGEQVCQASNPALPDETTEGLGVVLPILIPQAANNPYVSIPTLPNAEQMCGTDSGGGASFGDVNAGTATICPNGSAVKGGTCKAPRRAGAPAGTRFNCIAGREDRPPGTPTTFDARVYNLTPRNSDGTTISYQRRTGAANRTMTRGFYRIHANRQITGGTLPAQTGCSTTNETEQIGCLVEASPCSIGFSGLTAVNDIANPGTPDANRKGFALRSPVNPSVSGGAGVAVGPTDSAVELLIADSCDATSETPNGGVEDRYALARALWLCTIDGVPTTDGVNGSGVTVGTQTPAYLHDQAELTACFLDEDVVGDAAEGAGFVRLPAGENVEFVACGTP